MLDACRRVLRCQTKQASRGSGPRREGLSASCSGSWGLLASQSLVMNQRRSFFVSRLDIG